MIENFIEYMWYLLTTPLKKLKKALNKWYTLCRVFGRRFDEAKEDILRARDEGMIATCSHEMLPVHGADRRLTRYEGEWYENFRVRISMHEEICKLGGTNEGIHMAVSSLGFGQITIVTIKEYYGDPTRWAEFLVLIKMNLSNEFPIGLKILRKMVRQWKEVGAKDNYLIHAGEYGMLVIDYHNIIKLQTEVFPQYNLFPHYLEGAHSLSGNKCLSGYSEKNMADLYPVWIAVICQVRNMLNSIGAMWISSNILWLSMAEVNLIIELLVQTKIGQKKSVHTETHVSSRISYPIGARIEKHLRYLDGTGSLDGSRCLQADIYYYKL